MACRLFVAEPLSDPTWWFLSTKFISNAGNLSRLQCVKQSVLVKKLGCRVFFDLGYHFVLNENISILGSKPTSRRRQGLVWVNARRSDCWWSPLHTWVVTGSWLFMHAAGSRAGPIMPAACTVTGYCLDISESATEFCSSLVKVTDSVWQQSCICANFDGKYQTIVEWKGRKFYMFCKKKKVCFQRERY